MLPLLLDAPVGLGRDLRAIRVRSAEAARSALSAQFGALLDGNVMETAPRNQPQDERPEVAEIRAISG